MSLELSPREVWKSKKIEKAETTIFNEETLDLVDTLISQLSTLYDPYELEEKGALDVYSQIKAIQKLNIFLDQSFPKLTKRFLLKADLNSHLYFKLLLKI